MKLFAIILLSLMTSISFAKTKKSRAPANTGELGACQTQAGEAALAVVKALGQDVTIEDVKLNFIKTKFETYKVQLAGADSPETNNLITVKLVNTDSGCSLDAITMPVVTF